VKRFQFRLATVLRVRRIEEERARADLSLALLELARAEAAVAERKEQYWNAPRPGGSFAVGDFRPAWSDLESRARAIQWSVADRMRRAAHAEECRTAWLERKQRLGAIERLEEHAREAWKYSVGQEQEKLVDDIVVARAHAAKRTAALEVVQ
jgi:flagellar protein FliJ